MIGNDVIDLADPQCLPMGTHPRFDQRVFAPSELQVLHAGTTPAWTRWMLWAAKESAYKLLRKRDAAVTFTPRHFVVEPHDSAGGTDHAADCTPWSGDQVHGTVTGAGYRVAFRGFVNGEALHVIATDAAHGSSDRR